MKMLGDTDRFPCCDFCDSRRGPGFRKRARRMFKRTERQGWKRDVSQQAQDVKMG